MATKTRSFLRTALLGGAGAVLAYFFDPDQGRSRRTRARDRLLATLRRGSRRVERVGRHASAETYGLTQRAATLGREEEVPPNDAALAQKVRSEIFAGLDVPKDKVNINAEDGVVFLRGEVERPEQASALEQAARKVTGVVDVRNLLHTPGTPPPNTAGVRAT